METTLIESSNVEAFLTYLTLLSNSGLATLLTLTLIYRGSYLKTGFILLFISALALTIVSVSASAITWSGVFCRSAAYIVTSIFWRIKDFGLRSYILIRSNSLTDRKFQIVFYSIIMLLFVLNLFRAISVFTCLSNKGLNFFIWSQIRLEQIEVIMMLSIDVCLAILVFAYTVRRRKIFSDNYSYLFKLVDQNTSILFFVVLFISIPSYIMLILADFGIAQGNYAFPFSFVENLTLIILSIEFLNINISTRTKTSVSISNDSKPLQKF